MDRQSVVWRDGRCRCTRVGGVAAMWLRDCLLSFEFCAEWRWLPKPDIGPFLDERPVESAIRNPTFLR